MPAAIFQISPRDAQLASKRALITAAETNQLVVGSGKLATLIVAAVGTGAAAVIYDADGSNSNPIYRWATADGKVVLAFNCPFQNGLRVVTSGTMGEISLVYQE